MEGAEFSIDPNPAKPNEVADWLRAHVKLDADSKRLGITRQFDHDLTRMAFIRAADEIDNLSRELHEYRRKHPVTGF